MKARIWDFEAKKYSDGEIPDGSTAYKSDLDEVVPCASCGTPDRYGWMYTSRRIHTAFGLGYAVCGKCHERELADESGEEVVA